MAIHESTTLSDQLIQRERRGIWLALLVMIVLGSGAVAETSGYDSFVTRYMSLCAVLIALGIVVVASSRLLRQGTRVAAHRRTVRSDESRTQAIDKACRYSLSITLVSMAVYAILSQALPVVLLPSALIALFVVLGVVTFLAAFLWLDRG